MVFGTGRGKDRKRWITPPRSLPSGGLANTRAGWGRYADYLGWQAAEGPAGNNPAYASLSTGWALGSDEFKESLVRDHNLVAHVRAWEREGAKVVSEQRWLEKLQQVFGFLPAPMRQSAEQVRSLESCRRRISKSDHGRLESVAGYAV